MSTGTSALSDVAALLPPYAHSLGMTVARLEAGVPVLALDFIEAVHGRPGFVHGGAIGGLLEMAALAALRGELQRRADVTHPKPINLTVEYLRGVVAQRTFALARINRAGRRIVNVSAEAWQGEDRGRPVAMAWLNIRLASAPVAG